MDGIELLKRVGQLHPEMPSVLFTEKGREDVAIEAGTALLSKNPLDDVQRKHLEQMDRAIDNMGKVIKATKDYEVGRLGPSYRRRTERVKSILHG